MNTPESKKTFGLKDNILLRGAALLAGITAGCTETRTDVSNTVGNQPSVPIEKAADVVVPPEDLIDSLSLEQMQAVAKRLESETTISPEQMRAIIQKFETEGFDSVEGVDCVVLCAKDFVDAGFKEDQLPLGWSKNMREPAGRGSGYFLVPKAWLQSS